MVAFKAHAFTVSMAVFMVPVLITASLLFQLQSHSKFVRRVLIMNTTSSLFIILVNIGHTCLSNSVCPPGMKTSVIWCTLMGDFVHGSKLVICV